MTSLPLGRGVRRLAAAAALALTCGVLAAPAAEAGDRPWHHGDGHHGYGHHHRGGILALGDSVAFGYTPPAVTTPATYADADNFVGYPEVLGRWTGRRVTNASCPGETTDSMITPGAVSYACENSAGAPGGYRTAYPLHVAYDGTQLAFATAYLREHRRTRLVTLDIGANDVFLCQATTADQCTGADFGATVAKVRTNVATIVRTLRDDAGYRGRIVVLTYYSLDYRDATGTASIRALDAALTAAAKAEGASVANGFGAFRRASAGSGGDPCAAGLLIALPDGGCDVHPTRAGHRVLAAAVARAAHRH